MGRNMFGPIRGDRDEDWSGAWGAEPPYHAPVFMLTHYRHDPIHMEGGTTFHFVTEGFEEAYSAACEAAGDNGVDIAGGADRPTGVVRRRHRRAHPGHRTCPARLGRAHLRRGRVLRLRARRGAPLTADHSRQVPPRQLTRPARRSFAPPSHPAWTTHQSCWRTSPARAGSLDESRGERPAGHLDPSLARPEPYVHQTSSRADRATFDGSPRWRLLSFL